MRSLILAFAAAALFIGAAGCGESPTVTVYKQGKYSGKPDKQPWDNAQFNGDRNSWEESIKARSLNQNEYVRIGS